MEDAPEDDKPSDKQKKSGSSTAATRRAINPAIPESASLRKCNLHYCPMGIFSVTCLGSVDGGDGVEADEHETQDLLC